ncbi:hypothetical protein, partial [Frankia casuarinae]
MSEQQSTVNITEYLA